MKYTKENPLILSMSAVKAYATCPKSFDLSYVHNLMTDGNQATQEGSEFHDLMENGAAYCAGYIKQTPPNEENSQMWPVYQAYLKHKNPFRSTSWISIVAVEQPLFIKLKSNVWLRCTSDRVELANDGWYEIHDIKTFDRNVAPDNDLDFQARMYIWAWSKYFGTRDVRFVLDHVRRTPPHVVKDRSGGVWSIEDCYPQYPPILCSQRELDRLEDELHYKVDEILKKLKIEDEYKRSIAFYRSDSKAPFHCNTCFVRELCKAELLQGGLTEATKEALSSGVKNNVPLPKGAFGRKIYLATYKEALELRKLEKGEV